MCPRSHRPPGAASRGTGDRLPAVAATEEHVGHEPGGQGQPVGHDAVGQRGQQGLIRGHPCQHEHRRQARFDEAEAPGGQGDHRQHRGGAVGEEHEAEPGCHSDRHEGAHEGEVVEQPVADRGQQGRLPAGTESVHHQVPLLHQAFGGRSSRPLQLAEDRGGDPLEEVAERDQRSVEADQDEPHRQHQQEQRRAPPRHPVEAVRDRSAEDGDQ